MQSFAPWSRASRSAIALSRNWSSSWFEYTLEHQSRHGVAVLVEQVVGAEVELQTHEIVPGLGNDGVAAPLRQPSPQRRLVRQCVLHEPSGSRRLVRADVTGIRA